MKYPDYKWVDTAFGGVDKRNKLREAVGLKPPADMADCYRTVFRYPDEMRRHAEKTGSVGGYKGPVYADWLPIDIDDEDLSKAHERAQTLLQQLEVRLDAPIDQVRCFFSGAKGFHILIHQEMVGWEPGVDLPQRLRDMAIALADGVEIDTSIYDRMRLFRINNTQHSKTGLFKIGLTAREVLWHDLEHITEWAKTVRPTKDVAWVDPEPCEALKGVWAATQREQVDKPKVEAPQQGVMLDRYAKPCIAKMMQGGLGPGNRQAVAFRLAVHFRKQGLSGPVIMAVLREWNSTNIDGLEDKELEHAVQQALSGQYDFGCKDAIMQQFCGGACPFKKDELEADAGKDGVEVLDFRQAQQKYEEYVALLRQAKVTLGLDKLDEAMRGVAPGETCWLIARAGVGKTAFLLNILANNSVQGVDSLFCTLEQPAAQIYERATQISAQQTGRDVEQVFIKTLLARETGGPGPAEYDQWTEATWKKFEQVRLADADSMGMDRVVEAVSKYEQRYGSRPRIVAIDYLGRMDGGYGTPYEMVSKLARQSKSLAKKLQVALFIIHQVSREGGDGSQEVTLTMARDSGQVEESADFVIGLWRPDMKEAIRERRAEEPVQAAILKNRKGPLAQTRFKFDKAKMTFTPEWQPPETRSVSSGHKPADKRSRRPDESDEW